MPKSLLEQLLFFGDKIAKAHDFGSLSGNWIANCQSNLDTFFIFHNVVRRHDIEFEFHTPETFSSVSERIISKGTTEGRSEAWINHALQLHYWSDIGESFKAYSATNCFRTGTLAESIVRELQQDAFLPAAILARSLLEAQAAFRRQQLQLKEKLSNRLNANFDKGKHKVAEKELDEFIVKSIYGSTHISSSNDQKPTNIQTQIDKLSSDRQCGKLTTAYSFLCQLAHPTYHGTCLFVDSPDVNEFGALQTLIGNVPGFGAITAAYPTVWVLSWACSDFMKTQIDFKDTLMCIANEQKKHSDFLELD